jgi:hypothetical protein
MKTEPSDQPTLFEPPRSKRPDTLGAYRRERTTLGTRARAILTSLEEQGPATDREMVARLGFKDMNQVRPRVCELIKLDLVYARQIVLCETTGKRVRQVACREDA